MSKKKTVPNEKTKEVILYITPHLDLDLERFLKREVICIYSPKYPKPRLDQRLYRVVVEIPESMDFTKDPLEYKEKVQTPERPHGVYAKPGLRAYYGSPSRIKSCDLVLDARLKVDQTIPRYNVFVPVDDRSFFDDPIWMHSPTVKSNIELHAPKWEYRAYVTQVEEAESYLIAYVPVILNTEKAEGVIERALVDIHKAIDLLTDCIYDPNEPEGPDMETF